MMSSSRKSICTFGYIRQNYKHTVPEALCLMCLSYFEENVNITFTGKRLQNFLSIKTGNYHEKIIKFNNDLLFTVRLYPNGQTQQRKNKIEMTISLDFPNGNKNDIEDMAICFGRICGNTVIRYFKLDTNKISALSQQRWNLELKSECIGRESLSCIFIIHSLVINYKADIKLPVYYPSLNALKLQKETLIEWKVTDKALINRFKTCTGNMGHSSPVFNNWIIWVAPNGFDGQSSGTCFCLLHLVSWPQNVLRIKFKSFVKTNIDERETEYDHEYDINERMKTGQMEVMANDVFLRNSFERNLIQNDFVINVKIVIEELYDKNNERIDESLWSHHNVSTK